ncbi:MAG TPA: DUF305 domain-containing protein [Actinomycetota bacterium]
MGNSYVKLGIALFLSLIVMFVLTMSMIVTIDHFYFNWSNLWMAIIMVAPMGIIMLAVMGSMFENVRLNLALLAAFVIILVGAFFLGRAETFVGNEGFLRSMIPHHSRAILVCEEASITDPEIIELCDQIVEAQREEIRQMEQILERY